MRTKIFWVNFLSFSEDLIRHLCLIKYVIRNDYEHCSVESIYFYLLNICTSRVLLQVAHVEL